MPLTSNGQALSTSQKADVRNSIDVPSKNELATALATKANVSHSHEISDVNNLQQVLNSKSDVGHTHQISDVSGLQTALNSKAGAAEIATAIAGKADTSALTSGLAGKADVSALANKADTSALTSGLAGKADVSALASKADTSALTSGLATKADTSALTSGLASKADVSALASKADTSALTSGLAGKADVSALTAKADVSALTSGLAGKVDNSALTTALTAKADVSALTSGLAGKVDTTALTTALSTKVDIGTIQTLINVPSIQGKLDFATAVPFNASRSLTLADKNTIIDASATPGVVLTVPSGLGDPTFKCTVFIGISYLTVNNDTISRINYVPNTGVQYPPGIYTLIAHPIKVDNYLLEPLTATMSADEVLATKTPGYSAITIAASKTLATTDNRTILNCKGNPNLVINSTLPAGFTINEIRGQFTYSGTAIIQDTRVLTKGTALATLSPTSDPAVYNLSGTVYADPVFSEPGTIAEYYAPMRFGTQAGNYLEQPWPPNRMTAAVNDTDMAIMREQGGFDHYRIPACVGAHTDSLGNIDETFLTQLDAQVDWALARFDRVILDPLHHHNIWKGSKNQTLYEDYLIVQEFTNQQHADLATKIWVTLANRYKNKSLRLSFDLINEPSGSADGTLLSQAMLFDWYKNGVIPAIRNTGGNNLTRVIWMEQWGADYKTWPKIDDGNVGISPHFYNNYLLGNGGTLGSSFTDIAMYYTEMINYSKTNNVVFWVGETGIKTSLPADIRAEFIAFLRKFTYENAMAVSMWCWNSDFGVYNNKNNVPSLGNPKVWYPNMQQACSGRPYPLKVRPYGTQQPIWTAVTGGRYAKTSAVFSGNGGSFYDPVTGRMGNTTDNANGNANPTLNLYVFPDMEVLPGDTLLFRAKPGSITGDSLSVLPQICIWIPHAFHTWNSAIGRGKDFGFLGTGGPQKITEAGRSYVIPAITIPAYAPPGSRFYLGFSNRYEGSTATVYDQTKIAGSAIIEYARVRADAPPEGTKLQINNYTALVDGSPINIS